MLAYFGQSVRRHAALFALVPITRRVGDSAARVAWEEPLVRIEFLPPHPSASRSSHVAAVRLEPVEENEWRSKWMTNGCLQ